MRSLTLPTRSRRNQAIADRFGGRAAVYGAYTNLQKQIAARLAAHLPEVAGGHILEIGCGTGHLSEHLLAHYGDGRFLITDLSDAMVDACRARIGHRQGLSFDVMDGEWPDLETRFDVIASSMAVHWFEDPLAGLDRLRRLLKPGGALIYAALGAESFPEWRDYLRSEGLGSGTVQVPAWPGVIDEEQISIAFDDALSFFRALKGMGATHPRPGYSPMSAGAFRNALRGFDAACVNGVTWRIVYGCLQP